ncbi:MAG: hypothetical protein WC159_05950, partial [Sphaerochaetaceae bacterium]
MLYGLCDCNSFYASCERLFRPDMDNSPVVVLSNNDGCIVSLTAEAKALGIHRGDSLFSLAEIIRHTKVGVFSSNYALYQDLSDRVMETLHASVGSCQPYSIDEAFFTVETTSQAFVDGLRKEMLVKTGIPVSISVARTRTLAKLANEVSKHNATGAYSLPVEDEEHLLKASPAGEVWGIGWGSTA